MSKKKNIKIELPIDEIVEKWEQGTTQQELAKEYRLSIRTINRRISEYYEKEGKQKPKRKIEIPIDEIVKKWEQGVIEKELAKEYGVSQTTINNRISEYYKREGKQRPKKELNPKIELPIEEIVEKWKQGTIQQELAKEYGVSKTTITKRIAEYYEKKGNKKTKPKIKSKQKIELSIDEIVKKWEEGSTQTELAKEYGISLTTISSRISEYNREKEIKTKLLNYESAENNGKKLKIIRSSSIIAEYLRKGLTIEQIESIALKQNIIIPQKVVEKAIQRNEQLEKNKVEESSER